MENITRVVMVMVVALGALLSGAASGVSSEYEVEGVQNKYYKMSTSVSRVMNVHVSYSIETVERDGNLYDNIKLDEGGVEAGEHGEEVPFINYIFKTNVPITLMDVDMGPGRIIPLRPVPYVLPFIIGSPHEVIHPSWKGSEGITYRNDWNLILISNADGSYQYSLKIRPVEYAGGKMKIHDSISIYYNTREDPRMETWLPKTGKPTGDIKYLIITHEDLRDGLVPLAEWKNQKGLFSSLYTTKDIDTMYDSGDLASKMRKLVQEMEAVYDLDYLLLAGDYDKVPTRNTYNENPAYQYGEPSSFASDGYFACVDSGTTWNKDGDGRFGETGELDDAIPDLAVGRLAINNKTVMSEKIKELIDREKSPVLSANGLVPVYMGGDNRQVPGESPDIMDHFWNTYGNDVFDSRETIYYDGSGTMSFSKPSFARVIDDKHQFLGYFSHGQFDSIPNLFSRDDVGSFSGNGSAGVMFSMACLTGWFDRPTGGMISGTGDCFGESITEEPEAGLVGYIGATRLAVGSCDDVYSADAPGLQEDYYRAVRMVMKSDLEPTAGDIYRETVTRFSSSFYPFPSGPNDGGTRTFMEYNLLGEPDATVFTEEPTELFLEYEVSMDRSGVDAIVRDGNGSPVVNVTVAVSIYDELGVSSITDVDGKVSITIPPSNGGKATITAYRRGDIPDQSEFDLPDELAPTGILRVDPSEPDGNNGYYISPPVISILGDEAVTCEYRWDNKEAIIISQGEALSSSEGNHTLHYRVMDEAGHYSPWYIRNISVDTVPPMIDHSVSPIIPDGNNGFYVTEPEVSLISDEPVFEAQYSIDGKTRRPVTSAIKVQEGDHHIEYWAKDIAGNTANGNLTIKVDPTYPSSGILLSHLPDGESGYYITPPTLELYSLDPVAEVEYSWDGDKWERYLDPITVDEGINELRYRSRDPAGNIENEQSRIFLVDTVAPGLEVEMRPESAGGLDDHYIEKPKISAVSDDGAISYQMVEMGENISWSSGGAHLSGDLEVPDGYWTVQFRAEDLAGHQVFSDTIDLKVDTEAPDFFWQVSPQEPPTPSGWYIHHPSVSVSTNHSDAVIQYRDNDGDWKDYSNPIGIPEGIHRIDLRAYDRAGNEVFESLPPIKVDLDDPWVSITNLQNGSRFGPEDIELFWDGGDRTSETIFGFKLDDGPWSEFDKESSVILQGLENGGHSISVSIVDESGRKSMACRTFRIDRTLPEVVEASPSGTGNAINSRIEITFSEEMDRSTVVLEVNGIECNPDWIGNMISYFFPGGLEYGTTYHIEVIGSDTIGNEMEPFSSDFTTISVMVEAVPDQEPQSKGLPFIPIIGGAALLFLLIGAGITLILIRKGLKKGD